MPENKISGLHNSTEYGPPLEASSRNAGYEGGAVNRPFRVITFSSSPCCWQTPPALAQCGFGNGMLK